MVSGSFDLPSRVLFSFHSRYYCTIGLETYLELEMNVPQLHARYPTHVTLGHRNSSFWLILKGLSPTMVRLSRRLQVDQRRCIRAQQHHNSLKFLTAIRFALCRVRSPLLTASHLISFPAGTRMFRSPAFPLLPEQSED